MPLYELIGAVRVGNIAEVREIAKTAGTLVLRSRGVIRGVTNWGTFLLPKPTRKLGTLHNSGHYFIMRFDSSARTQHAVRKSMGLDPRMVRYSVVKMGSTLEQVKAVGGKAEWSQGSDV